MPYKHRSDLPDSVRKALARLPHAQDIYKAAFNNAYERLKDEGRAHAIAWNAVKKGYEKDENGKWHARKAG